MADKFSYDVFLSHNSKDKPRVRRLAERLKQAGLRVWFDEWNIKAGEIISLKVDEGLEQSRVLVLCISPNALASGWVALERTTAIHRDPLNESRRFIPLLLAECVLPDTLRRYKYVDFRNETDAAFGELLTACRLEAIEVPPVGKPTLKSKSTAGKGSKQPTLLAVLERTLTGPSSWVNTVTVSPNGKWLVAGSGIRTQKDGNLLLFDLEHDKTPIVLEKGEWVSSTAITPDGRKVVSALSRNKVGVWEIESCKRVQTLIGHTDEVWSVVALKDSARALSAGFDATIRLWDLNSGACLAKMQHGQDPDEHVFAIAAHPVGNRVLSGLRDGRLRLWDFKRNECLATMKGHTDPVYSLQIDGEGQFAVTGSADKTVKMWDLEKQTCVGTLEGHKKVVTAVAISPDGSLIASVGFTDKTVRIWDSKSAACLQTIETQEYSARNSVTFTPDGLQLIVGTIDGPIYIYRLTSLRPRLSDKSTRRYVNAKVVLLGEGTVGKTSLAHRLVEDKYVIRDRTHGMNVWPLQLPLPVDSTLEREALLWDLAGQEDYRLIHRLFLDETALALLLINPQKDDPFREAGDWLKALKTAGTERESAKLLIFSQVDVGEPKLGNAKIDRFCKEHGFSEWLLTSAKNGRNCSDEENLGQPSKLKQLIAESIPWEKLPWTATHPPVLVELKNAVMGMRDKTDIRLLRFAELTQRLEQALPNERFGESDVRTAVTLLGNQGLARALKFGDLVLLQPELLNGYASAIIRAARANKDEIGSVLEADIYKPDFDFTGVERLKHRPDEELLLHALVQTFLDHSLCIAEDLPNGRHLVFPSQYRREKDIPHDPDIFVSYTFSGEWQTIWTTLVVRLWYSQEFKHKELWRNAAEFASPKGFTLGLKIDNKQGEGTATVSLYFDKEVPDDLKAIFIEYVHRHLAKFGCEVSRDRRYVCSECGKPVKDLEEVRKRIEAKKDFIYCQGCDEKVPLIDFIEQHVKSDPVAQKILAMDETATRQLDTQALEQILIGHMMATCGEANQIFRSVAMSDNGIDGEVEFKDDNGKSSGKKIFVQLRSWNYFQRTRKRDGSEVFDVTNDHYLEYWINQPVDVYLVIRQTDEATGAQTIRWMNVTSYLKKRQDKRIRQIVFDGEKLDMEAVWRVRDQFFPPKVQRQK